MKTKASKNWGGARPNSGGKREGAGRKPQPVKMSDKALWHLGRLMTYADQNKLDTTLLQSAQNQIDEWLGKFIDDAPETVAWVKEKNKSK